MHKAVLISLGAHGLTMLLVFISVTFRQVRYIPRETYRVRLVSASVASPPMPAAPAAKETPPAPVPPSKEEPKKEELAQPVEKPKPKPQPKPAEGKPAQTVPRADIAKGDTSSTEAGEGAGETGVAADGISFDGGAFPYDAFVARMRHKIAAAWQVPAGSQTVERQAVIYFRVHRNGEITHVSIEQPSSVFLFDQSCQRAVIQAAPFPPLPRGYADEYLGVHFTFKFTPAQP